MSENFTVELPSQGYLYEGNPLPDGKAELRPMGKREEALLFQRGGNPMLKIQKIIDQRFEKIALTIGIISKKIVKKELKKLKKDIIKHITNFRK